MDVDDGGQEQGNRSSRRRIERECHRPRHLQITELYVFLYLPLKGLRGIKMAVELNGASAHKTVIWISSLHLPRL